jgi:hypothetical protein
MRADGYRKVQQGGNSLVLPPLPDAAQIVMVEERAK